MFGLEVPPKMNSIIVIKYNRLCSKKELWIWIAKEVIDNCKENKKEH